MKKIVVIGTGYVGLPAALMWAKKGQTVIGVDVNENVVKAINDRTMLLNEENLQELLHDPVVCKNLIAQNTPCEGDVFVIAVPTPVDELKKVADMSFIESAIESVCPYLRKGNLVIVESTIPPMSCRKFIIPLIEKRTAFKVPDDIMLAHCPERILPGDIFQEITHNDRLIGGVDRGSAEAGKELYQLFVEAELIITDDLSAEMTKLMENSYRDVNIALANEFSMICEDLGVDAKTVISYANRHPRVNILQPGIGVGGHCIPVDPWFLKEVAPYHSRLISMARLINDEMPARIAAAIRRRVCSINAPKILALGATYKKNCEDTRESPAARVVQLLLQDGYSIEHRDPLVPEMKYSSLTELCAGIDLVVVLVAHDLIVREICDFRDAIGSVMRNPDFMFCDE